MAAQQKFYGYFIPKTKKGGVTLTWKECQKKVNNIDGARFKSFSSKEAAEQWTEGGADYGQKETFAPGIYFDAGTGRGNGVEVSVTNEKWETLLPSLLPASQINKYGKHHLGKDFTNNYGELLACFFALQIALKKGIKKVFGDSSLVINFWSKGFIKENLIGPKTVELAKNVATLRKTFESQGGTITLISGGSNPADLGFH